MNDVMLWMYENPGKVVAELGDMSGVQEARAQHIESAGMCLDFYIRTANHQYGFLFTDTTEVQQSGEHVLRGLLRLYNRALTSPFMGLNTVYFVSDNEAELVPLANLGAHGLVIKATGPDDERLVKLIGGAPYGEDYMAMRMRVE